MTDRTCAICATPIPHVQASAMTCGSDFCRQQYRSEVSRKREATRVRGHKRPGEFRAVERRERVNVLKELVRWSEVAEEAEARRERSTKRAAEKRVAELVQLLGFDPLLYLPDRSIETAAAGDDALAKVVTRRQQALLRAIPGRTAQLAESAGINPQDVRPYLRKFVESGDVVIRTEGKATIWELP